MLKRASKGLATTLAWVLLIPAAFSQAPGVTRIAPMERADTLAYLERGNLPMDRMIAGVAHLPKRYAVLNVEFEDAAARQAFEKTQLKGSSVFARFERFADLFVDSGAALKAVESAPGVRWIDAVYRSAAPPPTLIEKGETARASADPILRSGKIEGLSGKGVIIVVIDTGIDFHHPDFIKQEGGKPVSRVLHFWDTVSTTEASKGLGERPPVAYPNGRALGIVYNREDLTAEIQGKQARIPVWDTDGHGTACASIAAGNGNGAPTPEYRDQVLGVAANADIIAVRLGEGKAITNTFLLGAICDWVNQKAGDRPVVYSCSYGGPGDFDGNRVLERQLDARFPSTAKGRAICIAAGNDGDLKMHARSTPTKSKGGIAWQSAGLVQLRVFYNLDSPADLQFDGLPADELKFVAKGTYRHALTDQVVTHAEVLTQRGQRNELRFTSKSGKDIIADAYLLSPGQFVGDGVEFGRQISSPASAAQAIAVGSYDWNGQFHRLGTLHDYDVNRFDAQGRFGILPIIIGQLSAYSNPGPSRSGKVVKPDVVAPGQWFTAAASRNTDAYLDTYGKYRLFNGTSAATPYVAGVIALMMEKKPTITLGEIKALLRTHARQDQYTQDASLQNAWGHGKLNLAAIQEIIKAIK